MSEAPKLKIPDMYGKPNNAIYLADTIRTTEKRLSALNLNFGISPEQAKAMNRKDVLSWLTKLCWLSYQFEDGFSRYDICKELYGLSYDQVIAMSAKEFFP